MVKLKSENRAIRQYGSVKRRGEAFGRQLSDQTLP